MKKITYKRVFVFCVACLCFVYITFPTISFASSDNFAETLKSISNVPKQCDQNGYAIFTINGIFTEEDQARANKRALEEKLPKYFNAEPLSVDYLYNPSHIGGLGDIFMVAYQKLFDTEIVEDHDFVIMLEDASAKFHNQKILLVGHSQGNFYANSLYDYLTQKTKQVNTNSLAVYGVATPASRVAGGGKYITYKNDEVISFVRDRKILNVLPANLDLDKFSFSSNGHSFNDIYIKYAGERIVSDIKSSLHSLSVDHTKNELLPCLQFVEVSFANRLLQATLSVIDPVAKVTKNTIKPTISTIYNFIDYTYSGFASVIGGGSANVVLVNDFMNDKNQEVPFGIEGNVDEEDTLVDIFQKNTEQITDTTQVELFGIEDIPKKVNPLDLTEKNIILLDTQTETKETILEKKSKDIVASVNRRSGGGGSSGVVKENTDTENSETGDEMDTEEEIQNEDIEESTENVDEIEDNVETEEESNEELDEDLNEDTEENIEEEPEEDFENSEGSFVDTTSPVITLIGDVVQFVKMTESYIDPGVFAIDDVDGEVSVFIDHVTDISLSPPYSYNIIYKAIDSAGNFSTKIRTVTTADNRYIEKYSFGIDEFGRNWQVWSFNGSNVYDWVNTYINNYLKQEFTIQTFPNLWCSQCLQMGIFKKGDPRKGFQYADLSALHLEGNPQNKMDGKLYRVVIQWDLGGYNYYVTNQDGYSNSGRYEVVGMNDNTWVGWNGSFNQFREFPSGYWEGVPYGSLFGRTGGSSMVLGVYPIYNLFGEINEEGDEDIVEDIQDDEEENNENENNETETNTEENNNEATEGSDETQEEENDGTDSEGIEETVQDEEENDDENTQEGETEEGTEDTEEGVGNEEDEEEVEDENEEQTLPPIYFSHTFNGVAGDVVFDVGDATNPQLLKINITANKSLVWGQTWIENINDSSQVKTFGGSIVCNVGEICIRGWNGKLSITGDPVIRGQYRVKVFASDSEGNSVEEYLPALITVTQP
ncbi:MAG: DUF5011 domain-containing protein [Candidatus Pacebacteria bacterium]|nr:DUF5011 domain-containing protein [Candidatus Paceibacterota bacterium]MCF7862515.1 DUF5011 domain-containing protein [Candidatus Paceibacterota bacterium]